MTERRSTPNPTIPANGLFSVRKPVRAGDARQPAHAGDTRQPAHAGDTRQPRRPNTRTELDLPADAARFMSRSKVHRTWALNRENEAAPMLPPFIIDQIRRREEEERRRIERDQPRVELPVDAYRPAPRPQPDAEEPDDPERGVVILDLG